MITALLLYLIIKEVVHGYRRKHSFDKGFLRGIEAATTIFETMKYRIESAAEINSIDVTLYITGKISYPT